MRPRPESLKSPAILNRRVRVMERKRQNCESAPRHLAKMVLDEMSDDLLDVCPLETIRAPFLLAGALGRNFTPIGLG
jgi:hypothetical protein